MDLHHSLTIPIDAYIGCLVGVVALILCESQKFSWLQRMPLFNCTFCVSCWIALAATKGDPYKAALAIVVSALAIFIIRLSLPEEEE